MFKNILRWIDSWSGVESQHTPTVENTQIQWLRILPFIVLHIACVAVFWVGVYGLLLALCCVFI